MVVEASDRRVATKQGYLCYQSQMLSDDRSYLLGVWKIVVCDDNASPKVSHDVTGWLVRGGEGMIIKGTKDSLWYLTPDLQHSNFPQTQTSDPSINSTQHGFSFFLGTQFTHISQQQRPAFIWTELLFVYYQLINAPLSFSSFLLPKDSMCLIYMRLFLCAFVDLAIYFCVFCVYSYIHESLCVEARS